MNYWKLNSQQLSRLNKLATDTYRFLYQLLNLFNWAIKLLISTWPTTGAFGVILVLQINERSFFWHLGFCFNSQSLVLPLDADIRGRAGNSILTHGIIIHRHSRTAFMCNTTSVDEIHNWLSSTKILINCSSLSAVFDSNKMCFSEQLCEKEQLFHLNCSFFVFSLLLHV